ncbi:mitochondrial ribosomal protein L50 [Carabus blaptoides fortunei]
MAALMKHGLFKIENRFSPKNLIRFYALKQRKPNPDKKIPPKIDSTAKSLAAKGFLRAQKAYTPPEDTLPRLKTICQNVLGSDSGTIPVTDMKKKFELLTACNNEFNHYIPNSLLHTIETVNDVVEFYKTPVNTTMPLDMMRNINLPENVHVQYEYHRFHPETDTMFDGVTAFPKSSTLVTGIKYRKKYQGHEARTTWPYNT